MQQQTLALHLIRPLGFSTDDKMLKRAGLDYWEYVNIMYYDSLDEFFEKNQGWNFIILKHMEKKPIPDFDYSDQKKNITSCLEGKQTDYLKK